MRSRRFFLAAVSVLATVVACRSNVEGGASAAGSAESVDASIFCCSDRDTCYESCRDQFRSVVRGAVAQQTSEGRSPLTWNVPVSTSVENGLTIDFAFFPAGQGADDNHDKLLILTSGIHGPEGPTGSTLQSMFVKTMLESTLARGVSVLLVHGINAYGFKHIIRFAPFDHVDLNRNSFAGDFPAPGTLDDSLYDPYRSVFEPQGPARFDDGLDFAAFSLKLVPDARSAIDGKLTQGLGEGQYRYPQGVYYGGTRFEEQHDLLLDGTTGIGHYLQTYRDVMHFDLHTGLGMRAMQLLPNPPFRQEVDALRNAVFVQAGYPLTQTGSQDFYTSFGDFSDFICGEVYQNGHRCVNMLIEYGTAIDANADFLTKTRAEVRSLYLTVRENQGFWRGWNSDAEQAAFEAEYWRMFYPDASDAAWRTMVLSESTKGWPLFIQRFADLDPAVLPSP